MLLATCFSGNACVLSTFNHREKTHQKKNAPKAMPASVFFHVLPVTLWVATAPPPKKKDNAGANDGDGDGDGDGDDDDDDTHTHVVV